MTEDALGVCLSSWLMIISMMSIAEYFDLPCFRSRSTAALIVDLVYPISNTLLTAMPFGLSSDEELIVANSASFLTASWRDCLWDDGWCGEGEKGCSSWFL